MSPSIVALIPARAGSKRIPGKNTKLLGGTPLIAWTINAARASGIFSGIVVSSDDGSINGVVNACGLENALLRPAAFATDRSPDLEWVRHALEHWPARDAFAILRPTSPFRTAATIQRAWRLFQERQPCDSLRAIETVRQHPGKMWTVGTDGLLIPIMPYKHPDGTPWHSSPTQSLKTCYVQNSSLEIAWTKTVRETGTISGSKILPFFTEGDEGFSIDYPGDFEEAERRLAAVTA